MRASALADTGAILALLDRDDAWHARCVDALADLSLPLVTSLAVLTELFHLLGDDPRSLDAGLSFVGSGALTIAPVGDQDVPGLDVLMRRYSDRPMDLADATLVLLARRERISTVFTVDHADFETYRIEGRKRFHVVPSR